MKKYILIATLFFSTIAYSQTYVNGKKVSNEATGVDVEVVNDEVYINGQPIDQYTEEISEEIEKWDGEQSEAEPAEDDNLYQTNNVDAYNKWYNTKGKKMIEEKNKKTKNVFLWIVGILGTGVISVSLIFIIAEIRKRLEYRKYKKSFDKPVIESNIVPSESSSNVIKNHSLDSDNKSSGLTEIPSAIKNKN